MKPVPGDLWPVPVPLERALPLSEATGTKRLYQSQLTFFLFCLKNPLRIVMKCSFLHTGSIKHFITKKKGVHKMCISLSLRSLTYNTLIMMSNVYLKLYITVIRNTFSSICWQLCNSPTQKHTSVPHLCPADTPLHPC